jgi:chromate reductase, NAD(P)H dehydrogenase (quinone)
MPATRSILAFAGSTRTGSLNKKIIEIAAAGARGAGGTVTLIDLRDYALPLYDGDLEARHALPPPAVELKRLFFAHRGLLIATPEYNGSIPGVLKNALDWVSRPAPGEKALACYDGKIAAVISASLGALGGARAQAHLRQILGTVNVTLLPQQCRVPLATEDSFDAVGHLRDTRATEHIRRVGAALVEFLARLSDGSA